MSSGEETRTDDVIEPTTPALRETFDPNMPARAGDVHALESRVSGLEGEVRGWRQALDQRLITIEKTIREALLGPKEFTDEEEEEVTLAKLELVGERIKAFVEVVKELCGATASIFKTPGCLVGMVGFCLFGGSFLVVAIPTGMAIDANWSDGVSITTIEAIRKGQENEVRVVNSDEDSEAAEAGSPDGG